MYGPNISDAQRQEKAAACKNKIHNGTLKKFFAAMFMDTSVLCCHWKPEYIDMKAAQQALNDERQQLFDLYIGRSDVTIIYDHITVSMLCGKDLSCYSNKN